MAEILVSPSYNAVHLWLNRHIGKATKCEFCKEENKDYEWALKKGHTYIKDITHFLQLCVQCHRRYDLCGVPHTEEHNRKIGQSQIGMKRRPRTEEEKARQSNAMKGKRFPNRKKYVITDEHRESLRIAAKSDWERRKLKSAL